jgi:DNA-binding response OmpR family regulator
MTKKILIVDDEKDIVTVLKMALERKNFQVFEANDGLSAIDMIEKEKYDLIILDIMMPKFDGNSVNMRLKSKEETAKIPVIIITGRGNVKKSIAEIKKELNIEAYLEKPFAVSMLIEKINEIFSKG